MRNPKVTLVLGLSALIVAGVLNVSRPHWLPTLGDVGGDAVLGFFYGVAIGLLLLTVWRHTHAQR